MRSPEGPLTPGPTRERGSALLLLPAGMLIVIMLAAIAFDLTLAFQRKRALVDLAGSAANDAVTAALDMDRLRVDGRYCIDSNRAASVVSQHLQLTDLAEVSVVAVQATGPDGCATSIAVVLTAPSSAVFARAIPGSGADVVLQARSVAAVVER